MSREGSPMGFDDYPPGKLGQFARRLGRISALTRLFGIIAVLLGAMVMLYGCSRADHRTDDAVALGALGIGLAALGALVWSVGTFHATFALSMARVASIDDRLEETQKLFRRLEQRAMQPIPQAPAAGNDAAPANGHAAAPAAAPVAAFVAPPKPAVPEARLCLKCGETLRPDVSRCRNCMTKVLEG